MTERIKNIYIHFKKTYVSGPDHETTPKDKEEAPGWVTWESLLVGMQVGSEMGCWMSSVLWERTQPCLKGTDSLFLERKSLGIFMAAGLKRTGC